MKMNKKSGFTLVELLIVMAVIAILIGMAVIPGFRGMQLEGRQTKAQAELKTLKTAIEAYFVDHNVYPAEASYQTALINNKPPILNVSLYDPFGQTSTTTYVYSLSTHNPATAMYYVIYSVGATRTGVASVDNSGTVTASGDVIYSTNGH